MTAQRFDLQPAPPRAALAVTAAPASLDPSMRLRFGSFEIDQENCRLLRDGSEVPLEQRSFDMLC